MSIRNQAAATQKVQLRANWKCPLNSSPRKIAKWAKASNCQHEARVIAAALLVAMLMLFSVTWLPVASQFRILLLLMLRKKSSSREVVLEVAFAEVRQGHRDSSNGGLKCIRRHHTSREEVVQLSFLLDKLGAEGHRLLLHRV